MYVYVSECVGRSVYIVRRGLYVGYPSLEAISLIIRLGLDSMYRTGFTLIS